MPNLLADIESTTVDTATATSAVMDEMTATVSVAGSGSVLLLIFAFTPEDSATDFRLDFDFWVAGAKITGSPTGLALGDQVDELNGCVMMHAVTGYTGSNTFAVAWREDSGAGVTDAAYPRTFKIIELLAAEATLLTDLSPTSAAALVTPAAVITDMTDTKTTAASAKHLMIANFYPDGGSDSQAILQFGIDSTIEGPAVGTWLDSGSLMSSSCIAWMRTGLSAASHTFQLYGDEIRGAVSAETAVNRTLQVIEITANTSVLSDLSPTSAASSGASYATMTDMTATVTPNNASSILLLLGTAYSSGGSDQVADVRWSVGGAQEGAEMSWYADLSDGPPGLTMPHVTTGVSGSTAFALEWMSRNSKPAIAVNTSYERSFQVIDFEVGAAPSGRIMSSLANHGGLAGAGGIAGTGGGLAG